jgi:hypothetical protein
MCIAGMNNDCVLNRPENGTPRAMEGVKHQLIVDCSMIDCSVMVQFYWCEVWCASDDWGSSLRWGMYSSLFLCTTAAKLGHIISF